MHRDTFARLAILAFGLVIASFFIMGVSRLFLPVGTARLLSAPTMLAALALIVFLTVRSVLAVSGLRPLDDG